jgi:hypothetical protein
MVSYLDMRRIRKSRSRHVEIDGLNPWHHLQRRFIYNKQVKIFMRHSTKSKIWIIRGQQQTLLIKREVVYQN